MAQETPNTFHESPVKSLGAYIFHTDAKHYHHDSQINLQLTIKYDICQVAPQWRYSCIHSISVVFVSHSAGNIGVFEIGGKSLPPHLRICNIVTNHHSLQTSLVGYEHTSLVLPRELFSQVIFPILERTIAPRISLFVDQL